MPEKNKNIRISLVVRLSVIVILISLIIVMNNVFIFNSFVSEFRDQSKNFVIYQPSVLVLDDLEELNIRSVSLIKSWVFIDKDTNTVQKKELEKLHNEEYPKFKQKVQQYFEQWNKEEQNEYLGLLVSMDSLIEKQAVIMDKLNFFEDYQNTEKMFSIFPQLTEFGDILSNSERVAQKVINMQQIFIDKMANNSIASKHELLRIRTISLIFTMTIVLLLILLAVFVFRNITFITRLLNSILRQTRKGYLPKVKELRRNDEIGELNNNLLGLIKHLRNLSDFAGAIGRNQFETNFKPASEGDVLGNSLLQMRDNLLKAQKEANVRQEENTQRNWASQGIAVFNEVIRDYSNDLEKLTMSVIERLVNYTEATIGGLFIVNEDNPDRKFLELKGFFAYDRHKFLKNIIEFGETLVGQCYVENDTIYITEVPDDYVYITSGLGSDKPSSILIVPLQFNDVTYGVIELSSFKKFAEYQIDFVEKISETIASAISTAKINERTTKLLEESNEKSKRLEQQEIQARENIAKVESKLTDIEKQYVTLLKNNNQLTKERTNLEQDIEKIKQKEQEMRELEQEKYNLMLTTINKFVPYYEMSMNGEILYANEQYTHQLNVPTNEVINNKHIKLISRDFITSGNYKNIWDKIKRREIVDVSVQYLIDGKNKFLNEIFIPVIDSKNRIVKISVFGKYK